DPKLLGHELFRRLRMQSILLPVLHARGQSVGILICMWHAGQAPITPEKVRLIEGIADQAALTIVNARLYEKAEELAVSRERMRVAAELHDGLSQTLFSLGLKLDWCLHRGPRTGGLRARLKEIKRDAAFIMLELRKLMYQVSPPGDPPPHAERLRDFLARFRQSSGVPLDYTERGDLGQLDPVQGDTLVKVFQEA